MKAATNFVRKQGAQLWLRIMRYPWRTAWVAGALAAVAVSCATVTRTVVAPPQIPGATFVGSEACADCHGEITGDFKTATHASVQAKGENAKEAGCESCHGPGSIHAEQGGGVGTIINPGKSPEVCFGCHVDLRGQFNLRYHHPLLEGKVSCSDCHEPHKGSAQRGGDTQLAQARETCLGCHPTQRGPYVFVHEAMMEGCVVCHQPHGSVNAKLLVQRNANLCLKCHIQEADPNIRIGGVSHRSFLRTGTCWNAGCHEAVHGSQVSTSLQY